VSIYSAFDLTEPPTFRARSEHSIQDATEVSYIMRNDEQVPIPFYGQQVFRLNTLFQM